jgi:hypothetical protein
VFLPVHLPTYLPAYLSIHLSATVVENLFVAHFQAPIPLICVRKRTNRIQSDTEKGTGFCWIDYSLVRLNAIGGEEQQNGSSISGFVVAQIMRALYAAHTIS